MENLLKYSFDLLLCVKMLDSTQTILKMFPLAYLKNNHPREVTKSALVLRSNLPLLSGTWDFLLPVNLSDSSY